MEIIKTVCDIAECKNLVKEHKKIKLSVLYLTEQTEGAQRDEPFINITILDLCDKCYKKFITGNVLYAAGAQGYSVYSYDRRNIYKSNDYIKDNRQ